MPMYAFKGISPSGKPINGVRDAEAPKILRQNLRKDGVLVTSFELSRGGKAAKESNAKKGGLSRDVDLGGFLGGVKKAEVAAFTRQMATLLKSGIPLAESLGWAGLAWVAAGGVIYTGGVVFYLFDEKVRHFHGVWHLFVLAGSAIHYTAVLLFVA